MHVADIDDCARRPCENGGVCIDGINAYTCQCPLEYYGDQCQYGEYANKCIVLTAFSSTALDAMYSVKTPTIPTSIFVPISRVLDISLGVVLPRKVKTVMK